MSRVFIGGDGTDTSAAVDAHLASHKLLILANLYLVGEADDPQALWLTDWESDLIWSPLGKFIHANVQRTKLSSAVGLKVRPVTLTWRPAAQAFTSSLATASPLQLARIGFYDNWKVRIWRTLMPAPGDANTFGACEAYGGWVQDTKFGRNGIEFTVNSFLDVVNQQCPPNLIENTNPLAGYQVAVPPAGFAQVPQFNAANPSSTNLVLGDCTSYAGHIFSNNVFQRGYLVFNRGAGATLGGLWRAVAENHSYTDPLTSAHHNQFTLYGALPWPPTAGVDTFYVSARMPVDLNDPATGPNRPFPYVPDPSQAI